MLKEGGKGGGGGGGGRREKRVNEGRREGTERGERGGRGRGRPEARLCRKEGEKVLMEGCSDVCEMEGKCSIGNVGEEIRKERRNGGK